MKRSVAPLLWFALLTTACAGDPDLGNRFRAERAFWKANAEVQRLSIRPELVNEATWQGAVEAFVAIPALYPARGNGIAARELHAVHAQSLLAAARIHGTLGDSVTMFDTYARIEKEFSDLPDVSGQVAFARGRLAENQGDWDGALVAYQNALSRVPPRSGDPGVAGVTLELPLRIARLRVVSARDSSMAFRHQVYGEAERYYGELITQVDTLTALDARAYLADVAADQLNWSEAARQLAELETLLAGMKPPPKDPASARYSLAQLQLRSKESPETIQATLRSIITTYPESPFALQSRIALAYSLAQTGRSEEALRPLEEVAEAKDTPEDMAGHAQLLQAQILDQMGRWSEAQSLLQALPVDHPLTEAALLAPIEVVRHYERVGDEAGTAAALEKAEAQYRDFLARYPTGGISVLAQEKLARTLAQEKRYELAVAEFVRLGEALGSRASGAQYLVAAAQLAVQELGDTLRAAEILDRTAVLYANNRMGRWASEEAARLRKSSAR